MQLIIKWDAEKTSLCQTSYVKVLALVIYRKKRVEHIRFLFVFFNEVKLVPKKCIFCFYLSECSSKNSTVINTLSGT